MMISVSGSDRIAGLKSLLDHHGLVYKNARFLQPSHREDSII